MSIGLSKNNKEFLNFPLYKVLALTYDMTKEKKGRYEMGEIRDNVKNNLVYYLHLKNITQKQLAEKLNVSQSAVTNWIKGKNSPDIDMVARICALLDISVNELFCKDPRAHLGTIDNTGSLGITPIANELLDTFNQLPESLQNDVLTYTKVTLAKHQMEHEQSLTAALAAFGGSSGEIHYTDEEMKKIKEVISSLKHTD